MISVRNIVTVDFDIINSEKSLGDFETTVYFVGGGISLLDSEGNSVTKLLLTDISQVDAQVSGNEAAKISINNYFENGGINLLVISPSVYTLDGFKTDLSEARTMADDFIYVCISNGLVGASGYVTSILQSIANYCDNSTSPEKVRLLLTTDSTTFLTDNSLSSSFSIVKYCTKTYNTVLIDAALLVGAYFSNMNLDGANTVKDYCYTEEDLIGIAEDTSAEGLSQETFENIIQNSNDGGYYNAIDNVANKIVNFGGNLATTDNVPIHTDFGAIAAERDITYSVLTQMLGKQYLTEEGMSNVKSAINNNLQRYRTNGYINSGSAYSGEDLIISYNGNKYNVIKSGTILSQGFYIYSVPVANISQADKAAKKFTPIYVILETQAGARIVEITGEVR